jgi:hypothetical protein
VCVCVCVCVCACACVCAYSKTHHQALAEPLRIACTRIRTLSQAAARKSRRCMTHSSISAMTNNRYNKHLTMRNSRPLGMCASTMIAHAFKSLMSLALECTRNQSTRTHGVNLGEVDSLFYFLNPAVRYLGEGVYCGQTVSVLWDTSNTLCVSHKSVPLNSCYLRPPESGPFCCAC